MTEEADESEATLQLGPSAGRFAPSVGDSSCPPVPVTTVPVAPGLLLAPVTTIPVAPGLAMSTATSSHNVLAKVGSAESEQISPTAATGVASAAPVPNLSDDPLFDLLDDGGPTLGLDGPPLAAPASPHQPSVSPVCEPAVSTSGGTCSSGLRPPVETLPSSTPPSLIGGGLKRAATQLLDLDHDASSPKEVLGGAPGDGSAAGEQAATLLTINSATAPDIPISCKPVSVGRGEHATVQLADLRASAEQFIVRAKPDGSGSFELEDLSRNGTFVSKKLVKGETIELHNNDLVEVLPAGKVGRAAAVGFLFQGPIKPDMLLVGPKRARLEDCSKEKSGGGGASSTDDLFEGATCIICQEVMHRATSVQPCLHSFCSSCLSAWLRKPGLATCPLCRKPVESVTRNHTLSGLIDGLLKAHPKQQRAATDLAQIEAQDALYDVGYDLAKLRSAGAAASGASGAAGLGVGLAAAAAVPAPPGDDSSASEGSDDESDDPGTARPPCFHCGSASWQTLSDAARGAAAGASGRDLARNAFHGNDFEAEVLQEWLLASGLSLQDAVQGVLATPNPAGSSPARVHLERPAAPGATALPAGSSWGAINACRSCAICVLQGLVYSVRERIHDAQLPARARGRQKCWYGRSCRTQGHKGEHAQRLDHICEQTRFR
mmetsp:Transcript_70982/g.140952  ORF Transcript_70982/g.140952 Transcript_70982/m.140952 type:complete len:662 (+) Transcript_70982:96-2081(+)